MTLRYRDQLRVWETGSGPRGNVSDRKLLLTPGSQLSQGEFEDSYVQSGIRDAIKWAGALDELLARKVTAEGSVQA
jgi:hypothetical protein